MANGIKLCTLVAKDMVREERCKRYFRGGFFIQRLVCLWNELPDEVIEGDTITTFKIHLDYG